MRYPDFLKSNGTIGFVAPSFGCATEPYITGFNRALDRFKGMGFGIELGSNVYEACGVGISNTPLKCGHELNEMYLSQDNDILISCGGGELMCEILEYIDFEKIKSSKAKWFLGYSDNTNFTFLQNTICDTASIYGSCAAAFGMEKWHPALEDTFDILMGKKHIVQGYEKWERESLKTEENPTPQYHLTEKKVLKCFHNGVLTDADRQSGFLGVTMQGRLLGGCMDCLVTLLGTTFDKVEEFNRRYAHDGVIWFLESCDLNVFAIRRAMWQMEHAGWFECARGFIIGRPLVFGQEMLGLDQYEAVIGVVEKHHVPIIMDADFGHLPPAMPIVSGAEAVVTAADNQITLDYQFV